RILYGRKLGKDLLGCISNHVFIPHLGLTDEYDSGLRNKCKKVINVAFNTTDIDCKIRPELSGQDVGILVLGQLRSPVGLGTVSVQYRVFIGVTRKADKLEVAALPGELPRND